MKTSTVLLVVALGLGALVSGALSANPDYAQALKKSILFYEAERSGDLPSSNRVSWRGDSALGDKGNNNEDLTGGWYDAGDHVKFGLPMASSVTLLAWGIIEFKSAYQEAGQYNNALDSIKWATDYFLKCHVSANELYIQVGNGDLDHAWWGRPEDMTMSRPAYKVDTSHPGSDVAGETAAALAAASIAFQSSDSGYSNTLLNSAKEIYNFAKNYRGKYSDSVPEAANFYRSSDFGDELAFAAAWLYRATGTSQYLNDAASLYNSYNLDWKSWAFSWDDKKSGVQLLMYMLTGQSKYKTHITAYLDAWLPGGEITYTPSGLAWRLQWGPLRYSANTAFLASIACRQNMGDKYCDFAKNQIDYMLGSNNQGRSYVIGFGNNYPDRPHHRSSSCPTDHSQTCDWNDYNYNGPNPAVLNGALVGGPDQYDNFANDRTDYVQNEVACDYNAGFQSAVAGVMTNL